MFFSGSVQRFPALAVMISSWNFGKTAMGFLQPKSQAKRNY